MSKKHNTVEAIEYLLTALESGVDADDYCREISNLRATLKKVTLVVHQPSYTEPSSLAFKIANAIADQFEVGFCNARMVEHFAEEIDKHLPTREPLSDNEIFNAWPPSKKSPCVHSFKAGVKFAEKAHGIGVDDE